MNGVVNIKSKKVLELLARNISPIIILFFPLTLHYLSSYLGLINISFSLNDYNILKEIYLILVSIYLGYLFLELLKVFQTPNIKWEVVNVEGQVYLKIQNLGDVLNKIFKLNTLSRLHAIIEIQSKTVFGRWISNPEPVSLGTSLNGQLVLLPDYSKIAFNRSTDILPYTYDNIVLLWKKSYQALTEYYIVDEFRYLPPYRYAPQNRIILPNIVKVTLYTEEDRYNLEINLDL